MNTPSMVLGEPKEMTNDELRNSSSRSTARNQRRSRKAHQRRRSGRNLWVGAERQQFSFDGIQDDAPAYGGWRSEQRWAHERARRRIGDWLYWRMVARHRLGDHTESQVGYLENVFLRWSKIYAEGKRPLKFSVICPFASLEGVYCFDQRVQNAYLVLCARCESRELHHFVNRVAAPPSKALPPLTAREVNVAQALLREYRMLCT